MTALNASAMCATVLIVALQWAPRFLDPGPLTLALGAMFMSLPVTHIIASGQVQALVILLVVVAMAVSQGRRPAAAGAALGSDCRICL